MSFKTMWCAMQVAVVAWGEELCPSMEVAIVVVDVHLAVLQSTDTPPQRGGGRAPCPSPPPPPPPSAMPYCAPHQIGGGDDEYGSSNWNEDSQDTRGDDLNDQDASVRIISLLYSIISCPCYMFLLHSIVLQYAPIRSHSFIGI
jgi:hypothetical protein